MFQSFVWPGSKPLTIQVYRLDSLDPLISGNKYYKLQPWLEKARFQQVGLMSCGGAFSNHLHALAGAGQRYAIATYGLVRGLEADNLTITLQDCQTMGMHLIAVSRQHYRKRYEADFPMAYQCTIRQKTLWVPEGGTDEAAVIACEQIGHDINRHQQTSHFDSVWLAVGSGGTLAGIARSLRHNVDLYAVPVMKFWEDVRQRVNGFLTTEQANRIHWIDQADYGGFGRANQQHIEFMAELEQKASIPFDPVYTSKLMRRLIDLHETSELKSVNPLVIHSGGLQGRRSIQNQLKFDLLPVG